MQKVLIVEDSNFLASLLKRSLESRLDAEVVRVASRAEAETTIAGTLPEDWLCLVDLNLPDAPDGEVAQMLAAQGFPIIVFTAMYDRAKRAGLFASGIIDFVLKDSPSSMDYVVSLTERILHNKQVKALVVEDSAPVRKLVTQQLRNQQITVLEAENGQEALYVLKENPDVTLVLTDYTMPFIDGFDLVRRIRADYPKDKLCIVGMSSTEEDDISVRFIKFGANDFLHKPFTSEELLCRVTQNLDMLDMVRKLREAATTDFLTGLMNRRYFMENGARMFANVLRTNVSMVVGMFDIDHFKLVNDTYGHDAGDDVLRAVAKILGDGFREGDVVARTGGEEFAVIAINLPDDQIFSVFDRVRRQVEDAVIQSDDHTIKVKISIGVCGVCGDSLDAMIKRADQCLYEAKDAGRNRLVVADR